MNEYKELSFDNRIEEYWVVYNDLKMRVALDRLPVSFTCIGNSTAVTSLHNAPFQTFIFETCMWNFERDGNLCPILKDGKWGFVNSKLQIVIEPMFDFVGEEIEDSNGACWRPPLYFHETKWVDGECKAVICGEEVNLKKEDDLIKFTYPSMRHFQEKERKTTDDFFKGLKEEDKWQFFIREDLRLGVILNGKPLGIDRRFTKLFVNKAADNNSNKKELWDFVKNNSCVATLRRVFKDGTPAVLSISLETGEKSFADWEPCLVSDRNKNTIVKHEPASFLNEQNTTYACALESLMNPSFDDVRRLSKTFLNTLPDIKRRDLFDELKRGVEILYSEPLMERYIYSYGRMHQAKLKYAFFNIPESFLSCPTINIIDYGCGQAVGVMCFVDFIRQRNIIQQVNTVTLIDPSEICLKRATLHVGRFLPSAKVVTINKGFDDLTQNDITIDEDIPTLHIFSNILDLDCFDLEKLASLIKGNLNGYNQFVCVSPTLQDKNRRNRVKAFTEALKPADYFYQALIDVNFHDCYFEAFPKEKEDDVFERWTNWTCTLSVFSLGNNLTNKAMSIFEKKNEGNAQPSDKAILRAIREAQPWLGRVDFSDISFAELLTRCAFVVQDSADNPIVIVDQGKILANKGVNGVIYGSFICWLRNVCLLNKNLYNNVLKNCFEKGNMCTSVNDKRTYVLTRLLKVNVDPIIEDVYLIVKGYSDATNAICRESIRLMNPNASRLTEYVSELNAKYKPTKSIDGLFSNTELAELYIRDLWSATEMIKI